MGKSQEEAKAVAKEEVKDRNMIHGDGEEAKAVAKEEVKDKNMADGNGRGGTSSNSYMGSLLMTVAAVLVSPLRSKLMRDS